MYVDPGEQCTPSTPNPSYVSYPRVPLNDVISKRTEFDVFFLDVSSCISCKPEDVVTIITDDFILKNKLLEYFYLISCIHATIKLK